MVQVAIELDACTNHQTIMPYCLFDTLAMLSNAMHAMCMGPMHFHHKSSYAYHCVPHAMQIISIANSQGNSTHILLFTHLHHTKGERAWWVELKVVIEKNNDVSMGTMDVLCA